MLNTLRNAFKIKDLRKGIIFTMLMLIVIRFGSSIPIPGVDPKYFQEFFKKHTGDALNFFNAMTGGSFEHMSVFALSITPYISSSIIIQLLTIAIPALEELQKDGEDGRKKIVAYTRYVTVGFALLQSSAMSIGFGRQGLLLNYGIMSVVVAVCAMTAGSAFLMWIGERITENGVGNGISMVLLFNILSSMPSDFGSLYDKFMKSKSVAMQVVIGLVILAITLAMTYFVVILQDAERRIPVQYSGKMQGRRMVGGQSSHIPLKVNTAGVMPVIFASSIMSFPVVISQFIGLKQGSIASEIMAYLDSSKWVNPDKPIYSIGLLIYIILIVLFAYFYTSITFNPLEVADNLKKQGGTISNIRTGKPTSDYLNKVLQPLVFIGAVGLIIVAVVPIIISGIYSIGRLSFTGTSLIIIVGVVLETLKAIESKMLVRNYKGFLKE